MKLKKLISYMEKNDINHVFYRKDKYMFSDNLAYLKKLDKDIPIGHASRELYTNVVTKMETEGFSEFQSVIVAEPDCELVRARCHYKTENLSQSIDLVGLYCKDMIIKCTPGYVATYYDYQVVTIKDKSIYKKLEVL